jgi:hypothetical protein
MKTGRSLQELAAEVARQAEAKRDYIAPTTDLRMVARRPVVAPAPPVVERPEPLQLVVAPPRGELILPGAPTPPEPGSSVHIAIPSLQQEWAVTGHAHQQIAARLREQLPGRPKNFAATYEALRTGHPDLLSSMVSELWRRNADQRLVRTLDGNVRAYLSDRYRVVDNDVVLRALLEAIVGTGLEMTVQSCQVTDAKLYVKVTFPGRRAQVRGDVVEVGVVGSNSEIGDGMIKVETLVWTLACSNGAIASRSLGSRHVGGREEKLSESSEIDYQSDTREAMNKTLLLQLRDAVTTAISEERFQAVVARMNQAADLPIVAQATKAVEVAAERYGFTGTEQNGVLEHLLRGGDLSQWGLSSAITRTSQDVPSYDRATEFEVIGGKVIELAPTEWVEIAAAGCEPKVAADLLALTREVLSRAPKAA